MVSRNQKNPGKNYQFALKYLVVLEYRIVLQPKTMNNTIKLKITGKYMFIVSDFEEELHQVQSYYLIRKS